MASLLLLRDVTNLDELRADALIDAACAEINADADEAGGSSVLPAAAATSSRTTSAAR